MIILLSTVNIVCQAQPTDLSDRELLIQLYSKMESVEEAVKRIEKNSTNLNEEIVGLDRRVSKNEINIAGFYGKLGELVSRWNYLLGLFVTFITGIFIWMWRKSYNNNKNKKAGTK